MGISKTNDRSVTDGDLGEDVRSVEMTHSGSIVGFTKDIVFLTIPFYHNY